MSGVCSPTVRRRELGALLRKLRTGKGLTVEQAADRLLFSMSKLSRMETGYGVATSRDIRDLCDLDFRNPWSRTRAHDEARRRRQAASLVAVLRSGGYATYVGLEAEAVSTPAFRVYRTCAHATMRHCPCLVFVTRTGKPLEARNVRRDFRKVVDAGRTGRQKQWAPRELRHSFVSLLSDAVESAD